MDDTLLAERFESLVAGAEPPAGAPADDLTDTERADLDLLVRLARAIPPATAVVAGPDPDFVTSLGVRLREEAHRRAAAVPAPGPATTPETPVRRLRLLPGGGRALRWAGGLVAAAVIAFGVLGVASRQALPGDLLYPVKQLLDRIAVQVSGSHYDKGMTWLAQAEQHIGEARQLIDRGAPPSGEVTTAYANASSAVRNAERELALDWQENHADRARLALPDFAATALPQLDAARPQVPETSVPSWQELRDLLAPYALMRQTGSVTPPGAEPTGLPTGGTTLPTPLPTGTATPPVGGTATVTPGVTPSARPTVPLPTVSAPLPTATVPLPTVSVPLPTVSVPLPTVTLGTRTVPLPTVSVPLPTVSVPLPTLTVPLPSVSLPLPTVTLPGL